MNKGRIILYCILAFIVFCVGGLATFEIYTLILSKPQSDTYVSGDLSIHFMELGNKYVGDSIYIKCGDNDILIDAGSRQDSATTIINYVDGYVTDNKLEYVIATHGHQDHIAAFVSTQNREGVFEHYEVGTIIDFPLSDSTSNILKNYKSAVEEEVGAGANHYTALECFNNQNGGSRKYQLSSNVELEILYNYYYENHSGDENNYSVCVMINQGDNHYLFTGDLEEDGEKRLVKYYDDNFGGLPHCVLYKAGHHGSGTSSTDELLAAITPEIVCICTCAGTCEYTTNNDNQFPYQVTVDKLAKYTDAVYVTSVVDVYSDSKSEYTVKSMNGNIVFTVKNGKCEVSCSNNNLKLKDTEWFKNNRQCPTSWK